MGLAQEVQKNTPNLTLTHTGKAIQNSSGWSEPLRGGLDRFAVAGGGADDTDNSAWVASSAGGWLRNVDGPSGLVAQVSATSTVLQFVNLHGDIMATADPVAKAVTATFTYTETGASETGTPGTYGWLGGQLRSSGALGGQVLMGARTYNTNTGRFNQTDPVAGASANAYDYCNAQPISCTDLLGMMPRWILYPLELAIGWGIAAAIDAWQPELVPYSPKIAGCLVGFVGSLITDWGNMKAILEDTIGLCAIAIMGGYRRELAEDIAWSASWRLDYYFMRARSLLWGWENCWGWC